MGIRSCIQGESTIYCGHLWEKVGESGTPVLAGVPPFRGGVERMFLGQFVHSIDTKGRITVPVRFRASLSSGATMVQGFEKNIVVYTTENFLKLAQQTNTLSTTNPDVRAIRRLIFGRASDVELDASGRILIPPFLREYAGIKDEVTIVGGGGYFEIWDSELWSEELPTVTDPEVNARRFAEFDLSAG